MRRLFAVCGIAVTVAVSACSSVVDGALRDTRQPTSRERSLRSSMRPAGPGGAALSDPAFEPLPGARAEYGTLGGATFRIEIPTRWNGRLVMWMHGYEELAVQATATAPDVRRNLIANGYAWAASSFSSTAFIPRLAADETAALWDEFVRKHGRPVRTYVSGQSMGGWATYERIVVGLTGGPRAFDRTGVHLEEETNFRRAILLGSTGLAPPRRAPYVLAPGSGVTGREFNRAAIRFPVDSRAQRLLWAGIEVTGDLAMPLLTLHTTGDGQVPINQAQILRGRVTAAGKSRLLVQRVIEDANHCGFRTAEQEAAFTALVKWVEKDRRPVGTNLDVNDLRSLDRTFELGLPRPGSPTDRGLVAKRRAVVTGRATLDGRPLDARWIGAVVRDGNLVTPCQHSLRPIRQGHFEITVLAAAESLGCGRPGAEIVLWTYARDQKLYALSPIRWPRNGRVSANVEFSSAAPRGASAATTEFSGEVYRASGVRVPAGAHVEAWIGSVLCGHASIGGSGFYILAVVGPDSIPACTGGGTIRFRVDGREAAETATNSPGKSGHLDLSIS